MELTKSKMLMDPTCSLSDMGQASGEEGAAEKCTVSPSDFVEFIPWACKQLEVEANVEIIRVNQTEYQRVQDRKPKGKHAAIKPVTSAISPSGEPVWKSISMSKDSESPNTVYITASYSHDSLVNLKIDKSSKIPRLVFRIIGLIVKFYPDLVAFHIHSGADCFTAYELAKLIPFSHITEISLDNTVIKEGNHYLLLESNQLKVLSLVRCQIGDIVLEKIAAKLAPPLPASESLTALNLSTNRLTDDGIKHLANVLRTNRKLRYLNLAGNMITDDGMQALLNVLYVFPLTTEELLKTRRKYINYLTKKHELIKSLITGFRITAPPSESDKRKAKMRPLRKEESKRRNLGGSLKPTDSYMEAVYQERAQNIACDTLGIFTDPLWDWCFTKDGTRYSNGNNTLAYLNVGYNNLSYSSLKAVLKVLGHQRSLFRLPQGLVNVCLDGNPMPVSCKEFEDIEQILDHGLRISERRGSTASSRKSVIKSRQSTMKLRH